MARHHGANCSDCAEIGIEQGLFRYASTQVSLAVHQEKQKWLTENFGWLGTLGVSIRSRTVKLLTLKNTSTTSLSPATTHFAHVHEVAIGMLFKIEWGRVCRYPTSRFATANRDFLEPNEHLFSGVNACRFDLTSVRLRAGGYGDHIRCGVRAPGLCRCEIQEKGSQ